MNNEHAAQQQIKEWLIVNRKLVFWGLFFVLFGWMLYAIKEITSLLILAYGIALLLDPIVDRLERMKIPRSAAIIGLSVFCVMIFLVLAAIAVPILITEYSVLITNLPSYLDTGSVKLEELLRNWFNIETSINLGKFVEEAKGIVRALDVEQMKNVTQAIQATVLSGYSFALTILNLTLLPFFVYYIGCDIDSFHRMVVRCLPAHVRGSVVSVCGEIMKHIYSFFKGQIIVSCIMAVLYSIGLEIVGLPSALIVGTIAGLLNIVPYLGVTLGFLLATLITVVHDFSWMQMGNIVAVFVVVGALEGTVLTPRIVGKSVGLHPLGVILALVIGGQLFGLLGLVLAIPAAASVRVLLQHAKRFVDSYDDLEAVPPQEETNSE